MHRPASCFNPNWTILCNARLPSATQGCPRLRPWHLAILANGCLGFGEISGGCFAVHAPRLCAGQRMCSRCWRLWRPGSRPCGAPLPTRCATWLRGGLACVAGSLGCKSNAGRGGYRGLRQHTRHAQAAVEMPLGAQLGQQMACQRVATKVLSSEAWDKQSPAPVVTPAGSVLLLTVPQLPTFAVGTRRQSTGRAWRGRSSRRWTQKTWRRLRGRSARRCRRCCARARPASRRAGSPPALRLCWPLALRLPRARQGTLQVQNQACYCVNFGSSYSRLPGHCR